MDGNRAPIDILSHVSFCTVARVRLPSSQHNLHPFFCCSQCCVFLFFRPMPRSAKSWELRVVRKYHAAPRCVARLPFAFQDPGSHSVTYRILLHRFPIDPAHAPILAVFFPKFAGADTMDHRLQYLVQKGAIIRKGYVSFLMSFRSLIVAFTHSLTCPLTHRPPMPVERPTGTAPAHQCSLSPPSPKEGFATLPSHHRSAPLGMLTFRAHWTGARSLRLNSTLKLLLMKCAQN